MGERGGDDSWEGDHGRDPRRFVYAPFHLGKAGSATAGILDLVVDARLIWDMEACS